MIEAIIITGFVYQAIAFFLLGSWKEAVAYEAEQVTVPSVISAVVAAVFWPAVLIWYLFSKK